jgi:CBS domain-containing protein
MSLEQDLQQELVIHLNLNNFTSVESETSIRATIAKMRAEDQHCAIVLDEGTLVGIFTDRDILRKVVDLPETWDRPIKEVMTRSPITVNCNEPADAALDLMDRKHFRNVPVLDDDGKVIGNLTHYAIIKYLADRFPESVYNLPPEPDQVTSNRDGA